MTNEEMLREIDSLPLEAQRQIKDFVLFLRERYKDSPSSKVTALADLETEGFVGMWRDREDMRDSTAWVRNVRETHWANK